MSLPASPFDLSWVTALMATLGCQGSVVAVRPSARTVAMLGYALCGLAALALICAASDWRLDRRDEETRTAALVATIKARSEMDRADVRVLRAIDAAKDMACDTPSPRTTDEKLLTAYTEMRTTCAFYTIIWIEAGRASDLQGVVEAAQKPWPGTSPPRQLWSYAPLTKTAREAANLLRRAQGPTGDEPASSDDLFAALLPYVLALLLAVASSRVTAEYRRRPR